ncbi:MAG: hypothetical protein LQ337_008286 [Flavoplaca oasis]|nr:MAG: hypothetical protein LQ337_008286 [Flavoplaca oasis]
MSGWVGHYVRALFAFDILLLLALIGTLIYTLIARKRIPAARTLFVCFLAAICFMILFSVFYFIDIILKEERATVQYVHTIFQLLYALLKLLADAFLLSAIFIYLLPRCFITKHPRVGCFLSKVPILLHVLFPGYIGLLWLTIFILTLAAIIQKANGSSGVVSTSDLSVIVSRLEFAYYVQYFLAALEIIVLAGMRLAFQLRPRGDGVQISRTRKSSLVFLLMISLPLLIRSIWSLTISARYTLRDYWKSDDLMEVVRVHFANMLFYLICTTLIYIGLALIIKGLGQDATLTSAYQLENGDGTAETSSGFPAMRVPAPAEMHEPGENVRPSRRSRDHGQDPIYNGP